MGYEIPALIAGLFVGALIVYLALKSVYNSRFEQWKATTLADEVKRNRADAVDTSRVVMKGKITEQIAPMLPEFRKDYDPADARFIGSPIDYLIFKNMCKGKDSEEQIEIILLDIKTGKAGLNGIQKKIETAAIAKRIEFRTLRVEIPDSESSEQDAAPSESQEVSVIPIEGIPGNSDSRNRA